jgi:hypothetical protein
MMVYKGCSGLEPATLMAFHHLSENQNRSVADHGRNIRQGSVITNQGIVGT